MALNFPDSPTNGQKYTDATTGETWTYETSTNSWTSDGLTTAAGIQYKGGLDITQVPPAGVANGWQYTVTTGGTANAGFTGLTGNIPTGTTILYDGANWQQAGAGVLWIRSGTTLKPVTDGDEVSTTGKVTGAKFHATDAASSNYFEGNTGIGGSAAAAPTASLHVSGATTVGGIYVEDDNTSQAAPAVRVTGKRSGGTASPAYGGKIVLDQQRTDAAISTSKTLGAVIFGGNYDATPNFCYPASITGVADGNWTSISDAPTGLAFSTGSTGEASTDAVGTYGAERMRIRSDGNVSIGGVGSATVTFINQKPITGGAVAYANYTLATVQSDVTSIALGYRSQLTTAAGSFTLSGLQHFSARQQALGAGSSVTNQYGFLADNSLTGATNNYGFSSNIASAPGRWNYYAPGTAPNYLTGDVRTGTVFTHNTPVTGTSIDVILSVSSILNGIRRGAPTVDITYTLPTGANLEAAFQDLQDGQGFEWSVQNVGTANITVAASADHDILGNAVFPPGIAGRLLTRKNSDGIFSTYRIA